MINMSFVSSLSWVKRGVAKKTPLKVSVNKEDLKRIIEETRIKLGSQGDADVEFEDEEMQPSEDVDSDAENGEEAGAKAVKRKKKSNEKEKQKADESEENDAEMEGIVDKYGLDDYDDDDDDEEEYTGTNILPGMGALAYYTNNDDDPYVTLKEEGDSDDEDDDIKPTDNLIVVGNQKDNAYILEVHVYNEELGNLFVHHEYLLPSVPLVTEWLNYKEAGGQPGNFIAIGSMEPTIDIWDLDQIDSLEPVTILGSKAERKKKKKKITSSGGHTDAVLGLSWNSIVGNVLASASVDTTIALWDLSEGKVVTTIKEHKHEVHCVKWHPLEAQSLLSGAFDKTVKVFDCRSPSDSHKTWNIKGKAEQVLWDHYNPMCFFASTELGMLHYVDIRNDKPVYTLSAHDAAVADMSLSSQIPGVLVTVSDDKMLKVWDVKDNKPSLVLHKNLKIGELFCAECCPEAPFVFAIGGMKGIKVWDIRESAAVRSHFKSRMPVQLAAECEGDEGDVSDDAETVEAMETLSLDYSQETEQTEKKKKKKKKKKKDNS